MIVLVPIPFGLLVLVGFVWLVTRRFKDDYERKVFRITLAVTFIPMILFAAYWALFLVA
jgi:hypothetical protein